MSFEYKIHLTKESGLFLARIDMSSLETLLNGFGAQGWELVSSFVINQSIAGSKALVMVLKRPLLHTENRIEMN